VIPDQPSEPGRRRLEAVVRGRVQGVGFRVYVVREATRLGLTGWVANESRGSVRCVAEGREPELRALLAQIELGPRGAWVDAVDASWSDATGAFDGFEIRSGWHSGD